MNLTIKKKLIMTFTLIILIIIGLGIYTQIVMGKLNDTTVDMARNYTVRLDLAHRIETDAYHYREAQYRYLASAAENNQVQQQKAEQELIELDKTVTERLNTYLDVAADSKKDDIRNIQNNWKTNQEYKDKMLALVKASRLDEARHLMTTEGKETHEVAVKVLDALTQHNVEAIQKADAEADIDFAAAVWTQIITLIVIILIVSVISYLLVRGINKSLSVIMSVSEKVGQGDLRENIPIISNDELGILAMSYNATIDNLRKLMQKIQMLADNVSAASYELNASADGSARL